MRTSLLGPATLGVLLGFAASGCGGGESAGPQEQVVLDGSWSGRVTGSTGETATLTLSISENDRDISGSGSLTLGQASLGLSVSGSYSPPNVTMTISSQGFEPMTLEATASEARMDGALDGSGFQNRAITLRRQ